MQKILYIVLFSALIAGCNSNSATTVKESKAARNERPVNNLQSKPGETDFDITGDENVDTLGLAQFLAIKAARFPEANRLYANISTGKKVVNVHTLSWAEYKRMRAKADRKPVAVATPQQRVATESKKPTGSQHSTKSKKEPVEQQSVTEAENKSADHSEIAEAPTDQTKEKKDVRKPVSNKTKGAIIGAVTGATTGAVINKRNRKAGGIVGGILGAAAGYGIGRHKDKKDTTAKREKQTTDNKQRY